jgi:N-acetylglucosamine-6-sulfatase
MGGVRRRAWVVAGVLVLLVGLAGGASQSLVSAQRVRPVAAQPPNIVFVLTDDLSWNLVPYMPQVRKLQDEGMTFDDYVVTDSLCCPSRASILTGRFPHNTGVYTNAGPDGGFRYFYAHGEEGDTFATALRARGYRTAMMGKYMNEYQPWHLVGGTEPYVPPGWTEWDVTGGGYSGFHYTLNENRNLVRYDGRPEDYLTDVLSNKGAAFITRSAKARKPFLLEVATFAPHAPYNPAPRHRDDFPGLTAPRGPAFNTMPVNAPRWLKERPKLAASDGQGIDATFRRRAQAVQSVDELIARLRTTLEAAGVADNTYIVFNSDNGFHMGEYRLKPGKMTAFDTDVKVPLIVTGPGVPAGTRNAAAAANIDLYPTFADIAGARRSALVDGRSLLPLLRGESEDGWRTANLVEHHGAVVRSDDPDRPEPGSGNPPSYEAMRTDEYTYVEYADGEREYYDLVRDPEQLHNLAGALTPSRAAELHAALTRLATCRGAEACWQAGHA